jgi:hypothetical protein
VQTPFVWDEHDDGWKKRYARDDPAHAEALRRAGEQRRVAQAGVKTRAS